MGRAGRGAELPQTASRISTFQNTFLLDRPFRSHQPKRDPSGEHVFDCEFGVAVRATLALSPSKTRSASPFPSRSSGDSALLAFETQARLLPSGSSEIQPKLAGCPCRTAGNRDSLVGPKHSFGPICSDERAWPHGPSWGNCHFGYVGGGSTESETDRRRRLHHAEPQAAVHQPD
jgi:hypothetical protein